MNPRDLDRLRDMLDEARRVMRFAEARPRSDFDTDEMLIYAIIHAIEIIGEAARHVTRETQALIPEIDWIALTAMRNRLAHDYLHVDYDIVWSVVSVQVPELISILEKHLP